MLLIPAAWGGLLDSSTATLSRDFGSSLAVALAQFSISMAHPLFPGHDAGIQARSLSAITARDFVVGQVHVNSPRCGKESAAALPSSDKGSSFFCLHSSVAFLGPLQSPWVVLYGHTPVHAKTMILILHGITLAVP